MKKLLPRRFLIGCASFTVAQTESIKVRVFNQSNVESLPFVTVDIDRTKSSVTTARVQFHPHLV